MSEVERRRPLSPHLQIFRPMLTMMMSIAHRITGVRSMSALCCSSGGLLQLRTVRPPSRRPPALRLDRRPVILFGFTWALFHHLLGGIRHAIWDTGYGMDHPAREYLAQATAIGGITLTVIVWAIAYMMR